MYTINKRTLPAVYDNLIRLVWWQGKRLKDQRGDKVRTLKRVCIETPCRNIKYPERAPVSEVLARDFTRNLLAPEGELKHDYTYGHRIHFLDNLDKVIIMLKDHKNTRRAVIPIFWPTDVKSKHEIPCVTQIMFSVESGKLDMTVTMRSNDVVGAFPSDAYGYMKLQEFVAGEIGLPTGTYCMYINDAHIILANDEQFMERLVRLRPLEY